LPQETIVSVYMRRREQGDDNTPLLATNSKNFPGVFQEIKMGGISFTRS